MAEELDIDFMQALQMIREGREYSTPIGAAQGGRIGFAGGKGIGWLLNLLKSKGGTKKGLEKIFREGPITTKFLDDFSKKGELEKFIRTRDMKGPGGSGLYENIADMPAGLQAAEFIKNVRIPGKNAIDYGKAEMYIGKKLKGNEPIDDLIEMYADTIKTEFKSGGGRIGYADKGFVDKIPEVDTENILKKLENFRKKRQDYEDAIFRSKRIEAQEGGLMDLGGMEKDYRQEGGFVPIGGEEKADDVPARLSKNEFVFTADAVRNAGGGDIDAGAEVMENLMEHLEAGGEVSEDSQGLEGAQEMFANTQRLQNRII